MRGVVRGDRGMMEGVGRKEAGKIATQMRWGTLELLTG